MAQPGMEASATTHDPDSGTTALVDKLEGHPDQVYGCIFVGDGDGSGPILATAAGTDLHLWDLERAAVVSKVGHEPIPVEAGSERWEPGFLFSLASDGGARNLLASACSAAPSGSSPTTPRRRPRRRWRCCSIRVRWVRDDAFVGERSRVHVDRRYRGSHDVRTMTR